MKLSKSPAEYWYHWVPYKKIPDQEAYVGFWIYLLGSKIVPCTFTEKDLVTNPKIKRMIKKIGRQALTHLLAQESGEVT